MTKTNDQIFEKVRTLIDQGDLSNLRAYLLKEGLTDTVNTLTNSDGLTPYLMAAEYGKTAIYDYLASLPNFNPTQQDNHGLNALSLATLRGKTAMFDHLVEKYGFSIGQTIRKEGGRHITPIYYAVQHNQTKMAKHLISHHLYGVSNDFIQYCTESGKTDVADYLKNLANLNQQLSAEISDHNLENFRKLCEAQGAKPKSAQQNLAEFAAINGALDIFKYLIDEQGFTKREIDLHYLATESFFINNPKLLEVLLLKYDFNPEQSLTYGDQEFTSLYQYSSTIHGSSNDVSRYLRSVETSNRHFKQAVQDQDPLLITEILSGGQVLKKNINDAALQCAINGNLELYKILAENPKFDQNTRDQDGHNALFHAAVSGNTRFVDYLISDRGFSFSEESRNQIMTAVLQKCDESKKFEMVSYLISKDIGFVFDDNFAQFPGIQTIAKQMPILTQDSWARHSSASRDRLKDYSELLHSQTPEVRDLIIQAQERTRAIFHSFLDRQNQESQIIERFADLQGSTENPYSAAKYLFSSQDHPTHEYLDLARFLTTQNYRTLYSRMAEAEPALRADRNKIGGAFLIASLEQESENSIKFFEFALENFGDVKEINRILVQKDFDQYEDTAEAEVKQKVFIYLKSLIDSGRIPVTRLPQEEVVSCIIPQDQDLKFWKSPNPEVFYSFEVLQNQGEQFNQEEQRFFNQLVERSQKDLLVPVREIKLSKEDLQAIEADRFDKNVFFIIKRQNLKANAAYPKTHDEENRIGHRIIIVNAGAILNRTPSMLHQLAIGVAGLKHSSDYGSSVDTPPNCDHSVTLDDTMMSHLCDGGDYSAHCYNLLIFSKEKDHFPREKVASFRESDVTAITKSLVKQYPGLDQKAIEFNNHRNSCPAEQRFGYSEASQLMLAAVVLGNVIRYCVNHFTKPSATVTGGQVNPITPPTTANEHQH